MAVTMIFNVPENLARDAELNEDTILTAHIEDGKLVVEVQEDVEMLSLLDFIEELTTTEQYTVLGYLSSKLIGAHMRSHEESEDFYGE